MGGENGVFFDRKNSFPHHFIKNFKNIFKKPADTGGPVSQQEGGKGNVGLKPEHLHPPNRHPYGGAF